MACERVNTATNTTNTSAASTNYIYNTLTRLDQLQKEASLESYCEGCDGGLMERIYNTKPVVIYLQGGTVFTVTIPNTTTPITTFRIEDVRSDAVVLRLLDLENETQCLDYTVILNIGCICGLQCLLPICCDACFRTCASQTIRNI